MTPRPDGFRAVQVRTTTIAMITLVAVLAVGAFGLIRFFEHQQLDQIDERLTPTSKLVRQLAGSASMSSIPAEASAAGFVQVVDPDGQVVFASDRLRYRQPILDATQRGSDDLHTADVEGLGRIRVISVPLQTTHVLIGESLQPVDDAVLALWRALVIGLPLLTAVLGGIIWVVVGRTLRPVRAAVDREQRLVADVSHELRTPLAGARALLESESSEPGEIELNRVEVLGLVGRLESITDELLVLSRIDDTTAGSMLGLVDLDDVVLAVVAELEGRSTKRIDVRGVSAGQVRGDEDQLSRMFLNLMTNAMRHAGTLIRVRLREEGNHVVLDVEPAGPGIPEPDRLRVFERFTRLDDARARDGAGAGLGLPIAQSVVTAHHGRIEIGSSALGGALIRVTIAASELSPDLASRPPSVLRR